MTVGNARAAEGQVYVCLMCGKVSRWKYGFDKNGVNDASPGWDEACMMNAHRFNEAHLGPSWVYPRAVTSVLLPWMRLTEESGDEHG